MGQKAKARAESIAHDKLHELVAAFDNAMLVTHAADGSSHARPMEIVDHSEQGDLWFVSRRDTQKVDEVLIDHRAVAIMQKEGKYLTVTGRAEIERDAKRIQELWRAHFRLWFKGKTDPNLVLIHLYAKEAEYWDNTGQEGFKFLLKAAAALVTGRELSSQMDDPKVHGKVVL